MPSEEFIRRTMENLGFPPEEIEETVGRLADEKYDRKKDEEVEKDLKLTALVRASEDLGGYEHQVTSREVLAKVMAQRGEEQ